MQDSATGITPAASGVTSTAEGAPTPKPRAHKHSFAHKTEYALARILEKSVSAMPEGMADSFGRRVGQAVYRMGVRRDVVDSNLRLAFPEKNEAWISAITRKAYEHLGREATAMMRLSKLDRKDVVERTTLTGWDEMEGALTEGRGLLLVTGHYGNWEVAAAAVAARGVPIAAIVRRQGNRLVDERVQELRRKLGVETIYQSQAPSRVQRLLRANGVVGIVGDQDARRSGIFVPFFGRAASTHRGPALFALRLNAPVFSCIARRLPGADVRYEIAGERVTVARTGDLETDVTALTADLAERLERQVRVAPEQYFWFHKRWKSSPPTTESAG
ncbi:MAG: lysophospholipid acyltransferase family protein [Gemmatimonadaceae bacterium]